MIIEIINCRCEDGLLVFDDNTFDSCVADSPYGLKFMGKKWDHDVPTRAQWQEIYRVMKPGAYLISFFGTRTYHRGVVQIEDAGFEIRDQIFWVFGSGMPKSRNGAWGGTGLKPAHEPIVVARKPLQGTVAQNHARWGTGGLAIDVCRVGDGDGRWPANLIHDGSDEVVAAFPAAPGQLADASTNPLSRKTQNVYGAMRRGRGGEPSANNENNGVVGFKMKPGQRRLDEGSAARFFYSAKASRSDRDDGCENFEKTPLLWSSGTQNPGSFQSAGTEKAARNNHPTVKPTSLMRYLCRLVTPAGGHILDPFAGSGSTGRGAVLEGFSFTGFELDARYCAIAEARIAAAK